jgi:tyrosinase
MATYTRTNAWNNGGTFNNPVLLWYAKAVGVMQSRQLNDTSSWWFFAAIHGENIAQGSFPGWGFLPSPPSVPTAPLPNPSDVDLYWDQCQHQSWYFPPWHRGYLLALEQQIRAAVVSLGGPAAWALPYWNYFGPNNQFEMPPAFAEQNLPDNGGPNPLYVAARYGPDSDENIYIPTPVGINQHPTDPNFVAGPVLEDCMSNDIYTGSDAATPPPGFGGPQTDPLFWHGGGTSGNLEGNPHNLVHVYVGSGSQAPLGGNEGLMSDPDIAALDPIFYLHHANIDRMWAVWNIANENSNDNAWLQGPQPPEREFAMPLPGGSWVYTPSQMSDLNQLNYTYDDLQPPAPVAPLMERLVRLGVPEEAAATAAEEVAPMITGKEIELVGASPKALKLGTTGARTTVQLDSNVRNKIAASLASVAETKNPDRVLLELENVRGQRDAYVLSAYVNLPPGESPGEHPELLAGSAALFGLRKASQPDGKHGGQGLNLVIDITKIIDDLHLRDALDTDSLNVSIVPQRPIDDAAQITVGRVNIYRQGD